MTIGVVIKTNEVMVQSLVLYGVSPDNLTFPPTCGSVSLADEESVRVKPATSIGGIINPATVALGLYGQ